MNAEAAVNAGSGGSIADSAASWAGWAVSSLTSKFYKASAKKPAADAESKNAAAEVPSSEKGDLSKIIRIHSSAF